MGIFVDIGWDSLNKFTEELCGDTVQTVEVEDGLIIVMADGLGSGVKANILSTLTTKIACTMLKNGEDIYETVDTIINTLPICNERKIAYCTFTIIKINYNGTAYIVEYDNPPFILIRNNKGLEVRKKESFIKDKKILISEFNLKKDDIIVVVSDGVIHAGIGEILNLGWQWQDVRNYLEKSTIKKKSAKNITKDLVDVCFDLYGGKPGDDTTVVGIKIRKPEYVDLFTGPPENKENDSYVINEFLKAKGKKVICGGTAANIAERVLKRKLDVNIDCIHEDVPPTSTMEGIDLITEGVITLSKTIEILKMYTENYCEQQKSYDIYDNNGAANLCRLLMEDCTHLNLWVGKGINPAHQNPDFPSDLNIKLKLVIELTDLMKKSGKKVNINYI